MRAVAAARVVDELAGAPRGLRARWEDGQRGRLRGRRQLVAVADALAQVGQSDLGVGAVDLAREAVAVEDRLGEQPRGDAVADPEHGLAESVELVVERVERDALGHEHDAGGRQLERLAVGVVAGQPAGLDAREDGSRADRDAALVQARADENVLERLGAERRDRRVARDELDLAPLAREQLGQRGSDQVALPVVDDDAAGPRAPPVQHHALRRQDVLRGRLGAGNRCAREGVEAIRRPAATRSPARLRMPRRPRSRRRSARGR